MKKFFLKKFFLSLILTAIFSCSSEISVLVKNSIEAYNEGKYLTSLFFAEQALLKNPEDENALLFATKSHLKLEEYEEADRKLERLIFLSDDPELLLIKSQISIGLEDYATALLYLDKYLNLDIKKKNEFAFFNTAYCYYQLGEYHTSLNYYLKYSSINPKNKDAYLNIAYLYGYLGKSDSAIYYYGKVLRIDSTNFNALYNRSIEYQTQRDYKNAAKDLELLNQYYPDNFNVLMDLAKLRMKNNRYFSAINDLTKAIQIDSTIAETYYLRGKALLELARNFSACLDFKKAGEMGYFEAFEMIKLHCTKKENK